MTALKSLLFFILAPGLLLGYIPYQISLSDMPIVDLGIFRYSAFLFSFAGLEMIVWCFWDFTFKGRGTPAPYDPPKELVVTGLYRIVRNPIYVGGVSILLGWTVWSTSMPLIWAPLFFWGAAHLVVVFYEESTLKEKFGPPYEEYLRTVPRWIPRFRNGW
jgi:protein-S-isoprenylcysteine O-methyltransferase Ste14